MSFNLVLDRSPARPGIYAACALDQWPAVNLKIGWKGCGKDDGGSDMWTIWMAMVTVTMVEEEMAAAIDTFSCRIRFQRQMLKKTKT